MEAFSHDPERLNDPVQIDRRSDANWLLAGLTVNSAKRPHRATDTLQLGCRVRVSVALDGQERLWCGDIVQRDDDQVTLALWGSGERLLIPLSAVRRASVVPRHTHAEHREVCERQRRGEPACVIEDDQPTAVEVYDPRPFVEVDADVAARIESFASAHSLSPSEAAERLLSVGLKRLAALRRYEEKKRERSAGLST